MNNIKTVFFMTLMGVIFLALGYVAGGRSGMTFALVFAIGINVFSYWFSDSMVLRMYNAREVGSDSRLYHIVQDLAKRDGLPVPRVYVIASDVPNAFATGRSPSHAAVAATEGILTMKRSVVCWLTKCLISNIVIFSSAPLWLPLLRPYPI